MAQREQTLGTQTSESSTASATAERQRWFIDPSAIMQIKNLTLRAKTIVEGFTAGLHRSPLHGFSVEFSEYRPYVVGDDPRNLDWKLLARTDRYYVKQYEDETNRRCYIAVDQSRSMAYGNGQYSKAQYAQTLAATLAYYLNMHRDAVGVMTCGNAAPEFLPPRHRTGHLQQIMRLLGHESAGVDSNLAGSLSQLASLSRRRGLVVLISDLLTEPLNRYHFLRARGKLSPPHLALLRQLASNSHEHYQGQQVVYGGRPVECSPAKETPVMFPTDYRCANR